MHFLKINEIYPKNTYRHFLNAFTPKSNDSNMNLEFLETIGDTVLKFITCWFLFSTFEDMSESALTVYKSALISNVYYIYQAHVL